ncbi:C4-dicarboxylate ABC transporter [Acuticoccus sediminis]|uniref:C4-dicarboxylate ABC transporter n=1 Tax=Acuticoccus sediminis TaxID=2184697 RepID=A0A8B2NM14_9HYPH|nr:TRAP transporter substrate-binding protein [Acuticoccus sediminis]RAH98854.1 C4-dicarboxylate ABC transporter [Acuticoccus sediminis]
MLRTALACALSLALPGSLAAQEVELSFAHWLPPTHPIQTTGFEPWAKSIEEASEGRIKINLFPAQQLGAAPDHYDLARDGIADMAWINPGYQPGRFPLIAVGELPFLVSDAKGGSRALHEWYSQYAAEEMPDVTFCFAQVHDPGTFHSKTPVHVPADVAGKNVRPAHATMARFVSLIGGASVQVPAPEAREAIAKGAADMITFPWESIYIFGIDKEVSHHLDTPLYVTTFALVMNKDMLDGLSEENRKVLMDHCTSEWAEKVVDGWIDVEAGGRTKMAESPDHTLYKPTADDLAKWREAAAPLTEEWMAAVSERGIDAQAAYDGFLAALDAHDARMPAGD